MSYTLVVLMTSLVSMLRLEANLGRKRTSGFLMLAVERMQEQQKLQKVGKFFLQYALQLMVYPT